MKRKHYIVAILLVPILLLLRFVVDIGYREPGTYTVTRVIDGDTVELDGHEQLRLLGIDTPEYGDLFFEQAKEYLANFVLHEKVRVELGHRKRDSYGRLLGYLYLDTIFINAEILKQGLAWMYLFSDNPHGQIILDQLYAAQHLALAEQVGVWTLPIIMEEEYYVGNVSSMRFHRPECRSAQRMSDNNKIMFSRPYDAYHEGYAPCRNCKP
jgi:micrococcal nuclease